MPQHERRKSGGGRGRGGSGGSTASPSLSSIAAAATSNKFAALLLDDDEDQEPDTKGEESDIYPEAPPASKKEEKKNSEKGEGEKDVAALASSAPAPTGRPSTSTSATSTTMGTTAPRVALRKPLFWLDLEMTGLDPATDSILEIAVVASDGIDLDVRIPGPSLAISATEEAVSRMNAWCVEHHGRSGLTEKCLDPGRSVPLREAERQVCEFVKRHRPPPREARKREEVDTGDGDGDEKGNSSSSSTSSPSSSGLPPRVIQDRATLAGNSVHVDFSFLRAHMPELASLCSHRLVDVSSFAEVARRWHPNAFYCAPPKQNAHEAMKDVFDSIDELKYWKAVMFKSSSEVTKAVARTGNARRG